MFQIFKTYLKSTDWFFKPEVKPMQLAQAQIRALGTTAQPINYQSAKQTMLISECDDAGNETPVAVAFITHDDSGMTLVKLCDLSEVE